MNKCKEFKFILEDLQDIFITMLIVILFHMFLGMQNSDILVSLLSCTNVSVYSHIVAISCALYTENVAKMWIEENRRKNLWTALFFKILVSIFMHLTLIKIVYTFLVETTLFNIGLTVVSILVGQIIERFIQEKISISSNIEEIFKYINIVFILILVISVMIGGI